MSSVMLLNDNPLYDPNDNSMKILYKMDIITTAFFVLEALIKIIAKGFLWGSLKNVKPYMSSYWNALDLLVVAASVLNIGFEIAGISMSSFQSLKALRALRGLRPLRVISRNEGMRLVVNALLTSLPSVANVVLVCILFLLIFSIIGVNQFKGKFGSCAPPS